MVRAASVAEAGHAVEVEVGQFFEHWEACGSDALLDAVALALRHLLLCQDVANRWRVTSTWWNREAAAAREYVKLVTVDGLLCAIYRDMTTGEWYLERIYD